MKRAGFIVLVVGGLAAATPALGFGISFGAPLEERVGGDYGPEYYQRGGYAAQATTDESRGRHCRTKLIETRSGLKRVRRCT